MPETHLHIISFDIPWPANYGGVIDVFYKIKALHAAGVKIHLHCFEYHRDPAPELEEFCEKIYYYPRKTNLFSALTLKPYIIYSRRDRELLKNLMQDNYPILFEGLHSCYYLSHPALKNRPKIYRESNIEHQYYFHLSKAEKNIFRKLYFIFSGLKLRTFQRKLSHASMMLTVSKEDNQYLRSAFPGKMVEYLPSFHHDDTVNCIAGKGDYVLYQGNLSVGENRKAAEYLIDNVFSKLEVPFIIAGLNPPETLKNLISRYKNISLVENPDENEMFSLIRNAHINVMVTFQATGLKLKLLHALFNGRHCMVNPEMIHGTELEGLCEIASTPENLRKMTLKLMGLPFNYSSVERRNSVLLRWHSNIQNCKKLIYFVSLFENNTDYEKNTGTS